VGGARGAGGDYGWLLGLRLRSGMITKSPPAPRRCGRRARPALVLIRKKKEMYFHIFSSAKVAART
jgi:hypothetical protein